MKKLTILIGILALMAGMIVVSCQREDLIVDTPEENVSGIIVTVNAGIASDPGTKSEVAIENGKRVLKFTKGDKLYVYRYISSSLALAGMLDMEGSPSADGKRASFTGTIKAYDNYLYETSYEFGPDPLVGTYATLVHKDRNAQAIYITVGSGPVLDFSKMSGDDVETVMTSSLYVQGDYDNLTKSYTLTSYNPIFNCSFSGLAASTEYTLRTECEDDSQNIFISDPRKFTTDANGNGRLAFISYDSGNRKWKMVIKNSDETVTIGEFGLGGYKTNITKKVYNVSRFWNGSAFCVITDLANITTNYTAQNGEALTGTLGRNVKISIAAGATVTLNNTTINGVNNNGYQWAGLNCEGDATIVLADGTTNTVKGFYQKYPGIHIPSGSTLTIQGTGTLNASSNGYGAGIGGGDNISCGNIIINSGTVTATGGSDGAGIGVGTSASCGTITITGGTVTATGGSSCAGIGSGYYYSSCSTITISGGTVTANGGTAAAGIGSGYNSSSCGAITIKNTVTRVTATGGVGAKSIGAGYDSNCGTVTIGGVVGAISMSPYTYIPGAISGTFSVSSTKQVYFSQGNLQYQASTNTWRFAEHQWDYVGDATKGNVYVSAVKSNNALIASDYSGWIDLFGWGTSGYNHGAAAYQPYSTSQEYTDYYAYGGAYYNLYEQTGRADWGYTVSAANLGGCSDWYTLKVNEWGYVFNTRSTTSGVRYAKAKVNGIAGVILLPDDWSTSYHSLASTNTASASYTTNNISSSDWTNDFEAHGAVFLPAAGRRYGTTLYDVGGRGDYWSSSNGGSQNTANCVYFISNSLNPQETNGRINGYSVRLVKDAN